ncbi:hypothetical protein IMCC20628_00490 [Hoeflea sp. IMCC20628]|uniref:hypothetical protein n=1 Tax=Hoeflea sp. IMCC20628 TaxID=1620421 RepID=UPI00063B0279|nr:hypothetical protein [Hoeflea sp. IMCC20628]AKH99214.1 hypothetical protein IMCC20628_00490 [Hoeflea sp. IMCC20628]
MTASANERASPLHYAKELGKRLESLGVDVHVSEHERYLVLLQDAPGQIIDLGRPLRGSRFFGHEAIRRNVPIVTDFTEFAAEYGLKNCMFWGIGLTGAKASADELVSAMKTFNARINIEFSELRKKHSFELLLIAIHPRFDLESGLFDLHAHFVCRVPSEHREAVHRRLLVKFSKTDLNTRPIRNAAAVATYSLWGIWRNEIMLSWPDHALEAAWSLTQHRFRLIRTGGAFAKWKACRRSAPEKMAKAIDKAKLKKNRQETAYSRPTVETGDRLLSKVMVRYGGKKVAAMLFEIRPTAEASCFADTVEAAEEYTSATIGTTQDSPNREQAKSPPLNAFEAIQRSTVRIYEGLSTFWSKISHMTASGKCRIELGISKQRKAILSLQHSPSLAAVIRELKRWRQ